MSDNDGILGDNEFGWSTLPLTDRMLNDEMPYPTLEEPADNVALRLTMLAHLCFNKKVWGNSKEAVIRYWPAFGVRLQGATNQPTVARWWNSLMVDLPGLPLKNIDYLHEKNILLRPALLMPTPVPDEDVLAVFRTNHLELADRTRAWAWARRQARNGGADDDVVKDEYALETGAACANG